MGEGNPRNKSGVYVVVDRATLRQSLCEAISTSDGFEVVGCAATISEAESAASRLAPAVIVLDVSVLDRLAIDWVRQTKQNLSTTKVIFLSPFEDEEIALAAISTGAEGYLLKSVTPEGFVSAIRSVASGCHVVDPCISRAVAKRAMSAWTHRPASPCLDQLSSREMEIVSLAVRRMTNQEIADAAFVSVNTVKTHLRRIYNRLGICSRGELIRAHQAYYADSRQ